MPAGDFASHAGIFMDAFSGYNKTMIDELWTVSIDEAKAFTEQQDGIIKKADAVYLYGGCVIGLSEAQDHVLGGMSFPRVRLELSGDEADVSEFHRRFVLRIMSAGG